MKKYYFILLPTILILVSFQTASFSQVRTSPKVKNNQKKAIYPKKKIDISAARNALARGTGSIRGKACVVVNKQRLRPQNVSVILFPVTPYFEEWHQLREKKADKKTAVYMSPEAYAMRIDTKTNNKGEFQFTEMKPGKYFIRMSFDYKSPRSRKVKTGEAVGVYGTKANIYQNKRYYVLKNATLEEFVEIKNPGDNENITLKKGFSGLLRMGC